MPSQRALVTHTRCLSAVFEPEVPAAEEEAAAAVGHRQGRTRSSGEQEEKKKRRTKWMRCTATD